VIIRLDGKRLKTALPDVTATVIMAVITAHVTVITIIASIGSGHRPLCGQAARGKMIAHEANPTNRHGHFLVCLSHQFDESEESHLGL